MAFPLVDCAGVELPEPCCSTLYDQGVSVLTTVVPYIEECIVDTGDCCGDPMRYFISIGRPETWLKDFVALWLENTIIQPAAGGQFPKQFFPPILLGQWRFVITESCYPALIQQGSALITPDDDDFHLAALHGYSHAQALMRGLLAWAAEHDCSTFGIRDFQPTRPEAGTAGWTLGFTLEWPR